MAESSPGGAGQVPSKCSFCDEAKIEVNCINCELFLCQPCCDRIHSKSKKLQDCNIINLKDFGTEYTADIHRKVDLENIDCADHKGQKCVSYCLVCDKTICLNCLTSSHNNHKQSDLKSYYDQTFSFIQRLQENINNDIPFYSEEERKLQRVLSEHKKEHNDLSDTILQLEQTIIQLVKNHAQKLCQELRDIYDPTKVTIQNALTKIIEEKNELLKRKESVDNILLSHKAKDIFSSKRSIDSTLPKKLLSEIQKSKVKFFPANSKKIDFDSIFGQFHKVPKFKLISTFRTNLRDASCLSHYNNNETSQTFVGSFVSEKLQNIEIENDIVKVIYEETVRVYDMAMKQNGDILISSRTNELKVYKQGGTIQTFKIFPNQLTLGIHVNKHDHIIQGLSEVKKIGDVKENTNIEMVIMSESGDIKHTYDFDKNNRLFTWPRRIVTCGDNICVTDVLNSFGEGRVVMIDYGGNVKWTYPGAGGGVNDGKFYPMGLTVTSTDMILVCDKSNHCIHVLNQSGEVIVCKNVINLGIIFPTSISIDTKGFVWVGCAISINDEQTAKLHQLKVV